MVFLYMLLNCTGYITDELWDVKDVQWYIQGDAFVEVTSL